MVRGGLDLANEVSKMRTLPQFIALAIAAALAACSVAPATFTLGDSQLAEDCTAVGDEDGNGQADCSDPACAGASACQPVCGNGKPEAGEQCDDGNTSSGDGCEADCTLQACGNGIADAGEQCDDGNARDGDGCDNSCLVSAIVYLKASNTGVNDQFGVGVALSADGSTLAVGAFLEDGGAAGIDGKQSDNSTLDAGAVYVFIRSGTTWIQQAYVKASNPGEGDQFGRRLALSADGSTLAVGAIGEDSAATGIDGDPAASFASASGAVYVFTRGGTTWSQEAYVKASNTGGGDQFGTSVAVSADGSTLVVGAIGENSAATGIGGDQADNSAGDSGAVYVFTRSGTTWSQEAYVKASNPGTDDLFGGSVALSADGSTLAVGAALEDSAATGIGGDQADNSALNAGAVYVFTRGGTTWSQEAYLKASNTGEGDQFGRSLALSADGSTLAVGAFLEDSAATGIGGDQANNSALNAGAVYVFTRGGTTWSQQAYVKASNTGVFDQFGDSVALSADGATLAVGAFLEDSAATGIGGDQADNSASDSGAVYVFTRSGTTWSQGAYVKASNAGASDQFGDSIALSADGTTLVVGALREDSAATGTGGDQADNASSASGSVYVFH
jgi:cysteine-rich repeat protein